MAHLVAFESPTHETRDYTRLFDRTEQYAELLARIAEIKVGIIAVIVGRGLAGLIYTFARPLIGI